MTPRSPAADVDGPAAPPRSNGELVFAEPWEGRAFGMAVTLADAGAFTWDDFRAHLVARLAARGGEGYYRCWLEALESVLVGCGRLGAGEVDARGDALAARPAGHDHDHGRAGSPHH